MSRRWGKALRRSATVVASAGVLTLVSASAALAFDDGGNPGTTGPNHIEWTGHGTSISAQDCQNEPNGMKDGTPYLLWVLTPDGGSVAQDGGKTFTPSPPWFPPVLHLTGTQSGLPGDYNPGDGSTAGALKHFVTPYFMPDVNTLHASVSMYVTDPGNGAWNLNISHGCAPSAPPAAKPPTITKTATGTYDTTYSWGIKKAANKTEMDTADGNATFHYTVTVTHDLGTPGNAQVNGAIDVKNPNSANVTASGLTDTLSDGTACTVDKSGGLTLNPGDNYFPYSCSLGGLPSGQLDNTATVSWDKQTLEDNSGSVLDAGSAPVTVSNIQFSQDKVNNGMVHVTDSLGGDLGTVSASDPSPKDLGYDYTFTGDQAGTCTTHDNTATITETGQTDSQKVKVCVGQDLRVSKDASPSFTRTYKWGITKSVDHSTINTPDNATFNYTVGVSHDNGADSGWQVTGNIKVTNPNDWEPVTLTGVTDKIDNGGLCKVTSGDPDATIDAGGSVTLGYECDYSSAPSSSKFTNTATASWDQSAASTPDGSADGPATGDFGAVQPNIVDGAVSVNDTLGGPQGTADYTQDNPSTFTYPYTFSGDKAGTCALHDNTATFTTKDTGATGSASQTVKVCVGADLTVSKTASPSFDRTYLWKIDKVADKTALLDGGKVNYTVTASQSGISDSNYRVKGKVAVTNPNDWEDVTLGSLSDAIDNGGSCTFDGGLPATITIPKSGSQSFAYTCTYGSAPSKLSGTNTATASWDKSAASTPTGSASGSADATFGDPANRINQTITVTDSQAGQLGTVTGTDSSPFTKKDFPYSKTFPAPASGCVTINNIAKIVETGQSASKSVQNCALGGLTMGFWQNKNGQGIIAGADQAKLANYLKGFAPFGDLSGSNATYITNIIKAATAAGASENAMLKAQMLATALDVYFSDPNLGGVKIGAFNGNGASQQPIGAAVVNLKNVNGQDVSGAFGGATSMKISDMLSYQNSVSNTGGTTWYGQVKATQDLAKNAFDAINNSQVTGP